MKIKIRPSFTISSFLILISAVFAVSACQTNKNGQVVNQDCSMVFSPKDGATVSTDDEFHNISQCKFLPLKINEETKCEISGSNKVDNLLNFYAQNPGDKIFFKAPLKSLKDIASDVSLRDKLKYYFLIQKIKANIDVDTGLFASLKDFRFKGMSCDTGGNKFTSWISADHIIVIYEQNQKVTKVKATKKPAKKIHTTK